MRARILHGLSSHYDKWDDFALFNDFTRTKINKLQKCKKERSHSKKTNRMQSIKKEIEKSYIQYIVIPYLVIQRTPIKSDF